MRALPHKVQRFIGELLCDMMQAWLDGYCTSCLVTNDSYIRD